MDSLPPDFVDRIKNLFPDKAEDILESFNHNKPTTFRVNTIKTTKQDLEKSLTSQGFKIDEADIPGAFILKNKTQRELTETEDYKNGLFYIQGLSSMIPPIELDPKENEFILDMCAAPGSKTTEISALMKNTGQIIANDMSKIRLFKLNANIKTLGATNIKTIHMNAKDLWKKFPNTFDKVLVDVPCSLEGRFNTSNPKSYGQWSVKKIKILSDHQKHILRSAVSCTKSGGTIVYSTCTMSPEENEEVVKWILTKCPEVKLIKEERIFPTETMEAFFVAKFVKS